MPDRIRAHVEGNEAFSPEVQDQVRKIYPRRDYMSFLRERDEARYAESYERAGLIDAGGSGKGPEPIKALADHYQARLVDLQTAAAEVGVTPDVFNQKMADKGTKSFNTARLIAQRGLPRLAFEVKYAAIVGISTKYRALRAKSVGRLKGFRSGAPRLPAKPAQKTGAFKLSLVSNKSRYKRGDRAFVCHPDISGMHAHRYSCQQRRLGHRSVSQQIPGPSDHQWGQRSAGAEWLGTVPVNLGKRWRRDRRRPL